MNVVAIRNDQLDQCWSSVSPLLEKALQKGYGEMDTDDIHTMLEEQSAVLILAVVGDNISAAIVATLVAKPAIRELVILTAGGEELDEWLDEVMESFDILAKEMQADIIAVHGRRGWVSKLKQYGYEEVHTTAIKRIA